MISKKDLLKEMNISYGQLYRWKREGLIPDEWFIKQSVSTGQETFFKRDLIIPRIKQILELKDQYQLEELKEFLKPNSQERVYTIRELILIDELDPFILKSYSRKKDVFNLLDVIVIYIFSYFKQYINYDDYEKYNLAERISINSAIYIIKNSDKYCMLILPENSFIDEKLEVELIIQVEGIASILARKL